MRRRINTDYFKNMIFGAEDSLVSTVGVLFGVASAQVSHREIITTGLVVIAVESLSMGAGSYLTASSAHEIDGTTKPKDNPIVDGAIMFTSYFLSGFVPLAPYIFLDVSVAKYVSLVTALAALFVLGLFPTKKVKSALRMLFVAGVAVLAGFLIGSLSNINA